MISMIIRPATSTSLSKFVSVAVGARIWFVLNVNLSSHSFIELKMTLNLNNPFMCRSSYERVLSPILILLYMSCSMFALNFPVRFIAVSLSVSYL